MKINLTTGIMSLVIVVVLTTGGWVVNLAVQGNDQKHIMVELQNQKQGDEDQKKRFEAHCDKQADDISYIKESLARLETKLGTYPRNRRMGKLVNEEDK